MKKQKQTLQSNCVVKKNIKIRNRIQKLKLKLDILVILGIYSQQFSACN